MSDHTFIAFDLETTGFSRNRDRIVEIGAVKFRADGTVVDRFASLVNPLRPCSPGAFAAHGITDAELATAPGEIEVLNQFAAWIGRRIDTQVIAHNASFDLDFLQAGFGRTHLAMPPGLFNPVDTLPLARQRWPGVSCSLPELAKRFPVLGGDDLHRAAADAERVRRLYLCLVLGWVPGADWQGRGANVWELVPPGTKPAI